MSLSYSTGKMRFFIFLCLFILPFQLIAQNTVIKGTVTDSEGKPLPGVSVSVRGSSGGTATNADGTFSLSVSKKGGEVIMFTSVDFVSKQSVLGSSNEVNVQLERSEQSLDAVVVVGYGTQKKRDVTGAVSSVSKERLQQLPNTNIAQALQGSVPGLQINTNGGGAESNNVTILIRGRRSITAEVGPLLIWDGIPYTGGISEINPNDVESIEVLKDASAVAIYGSRGSNGVILITSKQGKKGKIAITYDGHYATQELTNKPVLLTGPQFYQFKTTRLNANTNVLSPSEQAVYNSGKWVDWYDLATQKGARSQHSLSVRGGADKTSYYFGGTYLNVKGVAKNDEFKRYTLRPTLEIRATPWLTIGTSSQLSVQDRSGLPVEFEDTRNVGGGANFFNPLSTPFDSTGAPALYANNDDRQARNPLGFLLVKNDDKGYRIFTANNLKVDFPFLKGLSYKLNTGFEYENNQRKTYYGRNVALGSEKNGDAINYSSIGRNFTVENILNYSRELGKHSINVTALYSSQSEDFDRDEIEGTGFPNDVLTNYQMSSAALVIPSSTNFKQNLLSQMGRLNYGFAGKYLLTLTARRDGYSAFGDDKKYGVFPSAAIAWNIAEESFMNSIRLVNNLKLRVSYGENGNQAVSSYRSLATLASAPYISGSTILPGYFPNRLENENLGWETTTSLSVGLDFGFFKNRVQGSVDVYSAKTRDLLLLRNISPVHGVTSILQNIGKTSGKGVDIGVTTTNIKARDFSWTTNINFSGNKNKIVELYGDGKDDIGSRWFIGQPIRVNYGLVYDGIFRTQKEVDESVQKTAQPGYVKIKNINGDTVINTASDRTIIGQLDPKYTWGLTNTIKFKGFSFMIFFHGVKGVTKDNPLMDDNVFADTRRNTVLKDWWSPINPNGTHYSNDANANKQSVNFYEEASFGRLKDVSIAYEFPANMLSRIKVSGVKIYVTGRNLATYTKYKGLDPEFTNQYGLPLQKEMLVGLTIGL